MGKGTRIVTHEDMGSDMSIFYEREYGEGYHSTLAIDTHFHP
jgi:hypothetical protein